VELLYFFCFVFMLCSDKCYVLGFLYGILYDKWEKVVQGRLGVLCYDFSIIVILLFYVRKGTIALWDGKGQNSRGMG